MANIRVPVVKAFAVGAAVHVFSWTTDGVMGSVYIQNKGPNGCFFAWGNVPALTAVLGDGKWEIEADRALNLDDIDLTEITGICRAAETANIEIVAFRRPGSSGMGYG